MIISENVVHCDLPITEALAAIEKAVRKILFVTDSDGKLVGSVTDGDIRRALLSGIGMEAPINLVMNPSPAFKERGRPFNFAKMKERGVSVVPVVNHNQVLIGIEELSKDYPPIENRAVIMAGGLGSRLGELTRNTPKPMLKVGDRPILRLIMERLAYFGISNFYLSVNYRSEVIKEYFNDGQQFGWNIKYLEEPCRMGTAGSLKLFSDHQELSFLVLNGDIISDINISALLKNHEDMDSDFTVCVKDYSVTVPFGVVKAKNGIITQLEEKPKMSFDISAGFYVMSPGCLEHLPPDQYLDMPTFIKELIDSKLLIRSFSIDDYWIDVGHKDDLLKAKGEILE